MFFFFPYFINVYLRILEDNEIPVDKVIVFLKWSWMWNNLYVNETTSISQCRREPCISFGIPKRLGSIFSRSWDSVAVVDQRSTLEMCELSL